MARKRFDRDSNGVAEGQQPQGNVATQAPPTPGTEQPVEQRPRRGRQGAVAAEAATEHHVRDEPHDDHHARDRFGGLNWGAAFFGWLAAMGMAAILTAILSATGAAIGLTEGSTASDNAETVGIVGGALLVLALAISYFCGGYVAGRMSRFDGKRQGLGVWALGFVILIAVAIAGAIFGSEYNVFNELNLPRIPIEEGDLATGGAIALVLALLTTLLAAVLGGAKGRHYHDRVDRADGRDW